MSGVGRIALMVAVSTVCTPTTVASQEVRVERDVVYGHVDGMATAYDVSIPARPNGAGVIFIISGGFLSSLEQQRFISPVAEPLIEAGFTVFHLRHPSTPRYMAPEIYEALRPGVDHILEHAVDYGVEPSRVGIMGMSTGGMLALLLSFDVPPEVSAARGKRTAAVVAYMPVADIRPWVGRVEITPSLAFDPELAPSLSPVDFVTSDDPPTLLIHGNRDTVLPVEENSVRLRALLEQAGVPNELVVVDGGHELFTGEAKATADQAMVAWFSGHLLR